MEDIYDHLDNYDDVNALQELRSENQELKQKLEECTGAMGKLQKDYDDLALEFKKLEMNYSSLLKTARAEIERKTQIITNLNIEKDMMVLKSLQNGNNFRRSFYKGKANLNNESKKKDHNKNSEESQKINTDNIIERKDKSSLQSQEPVADSPMDSTNKTSELGLVNTCTDKKSEFKENVKHVQNPTPNIVASSISNRRKSMPAVSVQKEKFSSDDECEHKSPTKEIIKKYKPEQKLLSRGPNDTYGYKTSESSSLDGKNSNYQEHSRETQRNRPNRYYDDKYKSRDRNEPLQRYRRHNSPDRGNWRPPREYRDDYHYKSEHGRYRVLVSPPPDPYHHNNHMSNYHQRRNREPRPNYDRYPNEYDRYRNRYAEKHPYKHKMANDHEEPSSKRPRTESFGITGHFHPDEEKRYADIEVDRVGVSGLGHTLDIHDESCQSPDYIQTEAISAHPVREIMNTASTPLEDPRRCSSKYVIKTGAEGVTSISAVTGRNIDIKPIDKAAWNIECVDVPRALINHPSQFSEEVVHQIYMDIDNPVTNISMESGEICLDAEKMYSNDMYENDNKYREKVNENANSDLNKPMEEYPKSSQPITINDDNTQTACSTKYRIPKIKHDKNVREAKQKSAKLDPYNKDYKPNEENKHKQEYNSDNCTRDSMIERLRNTKNKIYCNERNENSEILSEGQNRYQSKMSLSAKVIVEGDLELSDDNSDVEVNIPVAIEKTDVQTAENRETVMSVAPSNIHEDCIGKLADKNDENLNNQEIDASTENKKETDGKKHKSKKKKSKSKDSKLAPNNTETIQVSDKKTRSKKDKVKPKEIEKKFSDLFGDSGSLIMPEDLGIATYVPSFDDAQDAVDLIIKQITKHPMSNVNEVCNGKVEAHVQNIGNPNSSSNCHEIEINVKNECGKVHHVDTDKTTSSKKYNEIVSPELPSNIVYKNLNPDVIVDNSNVVKTVVISTGVQPQLDMECNVEPDLDKTENNMESNPNVISGASQNPAVNEFNRLMKAVATSTPQKEFETLVEMENRVIESSCSRAGSIDSIPSAVGQSERTLDSNADVPDVRIFVKRRRKIIKKPPAT